LYFYFCFQVNILETYKNNKTEISVSNVFDAEAHLTVPINYGGNYLISVSTITPNAIPSSLINYRAPELPLPHQVKVFNMPGGHYEVSWQKPILPSTLQKS
jgi:hypothetical protein